MTKLRRFLREVEKDEGRKLTKEERENIIKYYPYQPLWSCAWYYFIWTKEYIHKHLCRAIEYLYKQIWYVTNIRKFRVEYYEWWLLSLDIVDFWHTMDMYKRMSRTKKLCCFSDDALREAVENFIRRAEKRCQCNK